MEYDGQEAGTSPRLGRNSISHTCKEYSLMKWSMSVSSYPSSHPCADIKIQLCHTVNYVTASLTMQLNSILSPSNLFPREYFPIDVPWKILRKFDFVLISFMIVLSRFANWIQFKEEPLMNVFRESRNVFSFFSFIGSVHSLLKTVSFLFDWHR